LFDFVRKEDDGKRLIVKINSHVSEDEIYSDFAKLYRTYKALNRERKPEITFSKKLKIWLKNCVMTLKKQSVPLLKRLFKGLVSISRLAFYAVPAKSYLC
jgi:hypothetical protein